MMRRPVPYVSIEEESDVLHTLADKLESGERLDGSEIVTIAGVMRALANGQAIGTALRANKYRKPWQQHLFEIQRAIKEHGSNKAAYKAIAKSEEPKITAAAVEKRYKRARRASREFHKHMYLEGEWGGWHVYATDEEIMRIAQADADPLTGTADEIAAFWRRRRDAHRAELLKLTGWKTLPEPQGAAEKQRQHALKRQRVGKPSSGGNE